MYTRQHLHVGDASIRVYDELAKNASLYAVPLSKGGVSDVLGQVTHQPRKSSVGKLRKFIHQQVRLVFRRPDWPGLLRNKLRKRSAFRNLR